MPPTKYAFRTDIGIAPLKRTYTTADTIWLEADVNGKMLFDTISSQFIKTDSASLAASITFLQFAANQTNPADGFCQIITPDINDTYRYLNKGVTVANFRNYGCDRNSLKWRIGIKPNYKGTYAAILQSDGNLQTCQNPSTPVPFYSLQKYRFSTSSLNQDVYLSLPDNERRADAYSTESFLQGFANRSVFMIKVE